MEPKILPVGEHYRVVLENEAGPTLAVEEQATDAAGGPTWNDVLQVRGSRVTIPYGFFLSLLRELKSLREPKPTGAKGRGAARRRAPKPPAAKASANGTDPDLKQLASLQERSRQKQRREARV